MLWIVCKMCLVIVDTSHFFNLIPIKAINQANPRLLLTGNFQKFLGLGLVGIDELSNGPASTQVLELQPRPYETENISGTLTVEVSSVKFSFAALKEFFLGFEFKAFENVFLSLFQFVFIDAPPAPAPRRQHMQQSFRGKSPSSQCSALKHPLPQCPSS